MKQNDFKNILKCVFYVVSFYFGHFLDIFLDIFGMFPKTFIDKNIDKNIQIITYEYIQEMVPNLIVAKDSIHGQREKSYLADTCVIHKFLDNCSV